MYIVFGAEPVDVCNAFLCARHLVGRLEPSCMNITLGHVEDLIRLGFWDLALIFKVRAELRSMYYGTVYVAAFHLGLQ